MLKLYSPAKEEEEKKYWEYKSSNFNDYYRLNDEKQLYSTAKIAREKNELPKTNFKPDDYETYNQLIINKPKAGSPADEVVNRYGARATLPSASSMDLTPVDATPKKKQFGEGFARGVGVAIDVINEPVKKVALQEVNKKTTAFYNMKQMLQDFSTKSPGEFLSTIKNDILPSSSMTVEDFGKRAGETYSNEKKKEEQKSVNEFLFGTRSGMGDILDFNTAYEKRKQIRDENPQLAETFDKIEPYGVVVDVVAGVATGVGTSKTLGKYALKAGTTTLGGKVITTLAKTIDPSLSNMAKFGLGMGALGVVNYATTGEFLFEDEGARQGQLFGLGALGIKGAVDGTKMMKNVLSDPEFQKGFTLFTERMSDELAERADNYATKVGAKMNIVENSKPLGEYQTKLYHGSDMLLSEFKSSRDRLKAGENVIPSNLGGYSDFVYFTDDKKIANNFANARAFRVEGGKGTPKVNEGFIKGKTIDFTKNALELTESDIKDYRLILKSMGGVDDGKITALEGSDGKIINAIKALIKNKGNDYSSSLDFMTFEKSKKLSTALSENNISGFKFNDRSTSGQYIKAYGIVPSDVKTKKQLSNTNIGSYKKANTLISQLNLNQTNKGGGLDDFDVKALKETGIDPYDIDFKINGIQELREQGLLKYAKQDDKGLSFIWTSKALKDKRIKTMGKGFHVPVDTFNKTTGETLGDKFEKTLIDQVKEDEVLDAIEASMAKTQEVVKPDNYIKAKAKKLGMWDDKKSGASNYLSFIYNRAGMNIAKREFKWMGRQFGDTRANLFTLKSANKANEKALYNAQEFGKAEKVYGELNDIQKVVGRDIKEFNKYLSMKSRWQKTLNEANKGKELATVVDVNGVKLKLTPKQMESIWRKGEKTFSRVADRVYAVNRSVLDLEVNAGVITREQADKWMKENPYYIPDKLDAEKYSEIARKNGFSNTSSPYIKSLKGGSDTQQFNVDALDNLGGQLGGRIRYAVNSKQGNVLLDLASKNNSDVARIVKPGAKLREGYSTIISYEGGKERMIEVPKVWKEFVENNDRASLNTFLHLVATPTDFVKMWATGPLNPAFAVKAIAYEVPLGIRKTMSNGGSPIDFIKSLTGVKSLKNASQETKIAMSALLKSEGGDFSRSKFLRTEASNFDKTLGLKPQTKAEALKNVLYGYENWIEVGTTRLPTFEAMMKKNGLTREQFDTVAKKYVKVADGQTYFPKGETSVTAMRKELESMGVNFKDATYASRGLFDYGIASNGINKMARFIPYLNTAVANVVSSKALLEDNPKQYMTYIAGVTGLATMFYSYNYSDERGDTLRRQNAFVRTKVGFINHDEISGKTYVNDIIGNNIQELEWIYPMVVDYMENGSVGIEGFNKAVNDLTYFGDLEKGVNLSKLPPIAKQIGEIATNTDFFYGKKLVRQDLEDNTKEFDRYTNPTMIKFAEMTALLTGGKKREDGIIEGGVNWSPKKWDKAFDIVDPLGRMRDFLALTMNEITDIGVTESNTKKIRTSLSRVYKTLDGDIQSGQPVEFKADEYKATHKVLMQNKLDSATTKDELFQIAGELKKEYSQYDNYDSDLKSILGDQMKDKLAQIEYGKTYFYESRKSAKEYAEMLANEVQNGDPMKAKSKFKLVKKRKTFSDKKLKDINEYFTQLVRENGLEDKLK